MPPRQKTKCRQTCWQQGRWTGVVCQSTFFLIWAQVLNSYLGLHIAAIMLTALPSHKTHTHTHSHKEHTYEQTYSTTRHLPAYSFTSLSLFSSFKDLSFVWNHSLFTVWSTIFPLCHLIWVSECVICVLYSMGKKYSIVEQNVMKVYTTFYYMTFIYLVFDGGKLIIQPCVASKLYPWICILPLNAMSRVILLSIPLDPLTCN